MEYFKVSYSYVHSMTRFNVESKFLALDRADAIFKIKKQYIGYHVDILDVEEIEVKPHGVDLL